jgi:hypothetical protein
MKGTKTGTGATVFCDGDATVDGMVRDGGVRALRLILRVSGGRDVQLGILEAVPWGGAGGVRDFSQDVEARGPKPRE